jgi:hypothetical protein
MQTAPQTVLPLRLPVQRPGESYAEFAKRMRGLDALAALNRTFEERRLELAVEDARREGRMAGERTGHVQGFWWGFICGGCCAALAGALSVVGWAWLTRGPLL